MTQRVIQQKVRFTLIGLMMAAVLVLPSAVAAHGPKGHGTAGPTNMMVMQKGMQLYEKLIVGQKLDETWETHMNAMSVATRTGDKGKKEFVVRFSRSQGKPEAVYIFFDDRGEYSGSNFTGE